MWVRMPLGTPEGGILLPGMAPQENCVLYPHGSAPRVNGSSFLRVPGMWRCSQGE